MSNFYFLRFLIEDIYLSVNFILYFVEKEENQILLFYLKLFGKKGKMMSEIC